MNSSPSTKDRAALQAAFAPSLDFQAHLAKLEAQGLLVRVDKPINKDTELHPLVRWQFLGGIPEDDRRAFLFTNVTDSHGRRYDIPVAVGALAASAKIYAIGMGRPVEEIGAAWMRAIANPIAPIAVSSPVLPRSGHHRRRVAQARRRSGELACANFHAGLRLRAVSHRDAVHHARIPRPACATWELIVAR